MSRRLIVAILCWTASLAPMAAAGDVPCPNPARSRTPVEQFKKLNPCPPTCATYVREGSRFVLYQRCGSCQVDHICPLACCGADAVENLQWLTARENRAKSADCTACAVPSLD